LLVNIAAKTCIKINFTNFIGINTEKLGWKLFYRMKNFNYKNEP